MDTRPIGYLVGTFACFPILLVLIIGSIYYWMKGRSIPFRQAVFNWRVILLSVILYLMSLVSRVGSYVQQESSHVYPEREVKGFTTSCIESAGSGLDSAIAERVCSCAIIDIQKAYTYGEFKNLATEMEKSKVVPSDLQDIFVSCAKKESQ